MPKNPLLVSVRSGAKFSMPGMMNTILNLGLNDETVEGLVAKSGNPRFAYDCYRRFIQMFGEVVLEVDMDKFDHIFDARKKKAKVKLDTDLTAEDLQASHRRTTRSWSRRRPEAVPAGRARAARRCRATPCSAPGGIRRRHYYRKMEKIPDDIGTAVNVQAMVFGNLGDTSATGVGFTRDPGHRREGLLRRVPGERAGRRRGGRHPHAAADLRARKVACRRSTTSSARSPPASKSTTATCRISSSPSKDGKLYMLQTRNGKRTGPAAVRVAVEMVEEGLIDKKEAVLRVAPQQLDQLLHPVFDPDVARRSSTQVANGHRGLSRRRGRRDRVHRR